MLYPREHHLNAIVTRRNLPLVPRSHCKSVEVSLKYQDRIDILFYSIIVCTVLGIYTSALLVQSHMNRTVHSLQLTIVLTATHYHTHCNSLSHSLQLTIVLTATNYRTHCNSLPHSLQLTIVLTVTNYCTHCHTHCNTHQNMTSINTI